jgi:sulfate-transporting ATPase
MSEVVQFAILGLATGSLYVLISTGLVIIYRGSGIINFAQGAVAMVGTYVWWDLNANHGWPWLAAAVAGVCVSALCGVVVQLGIMRRLRDAPPIVRLIATLGILVVLEQVILLSYPSTLIAVPSELPTWTVHPLGATIGIDRVLIFVIVLAIVGSLWIYYRYSRFGLTTAAGTETRGALAALGLSPDRVAATNWAIGSGLGAVAGILLAPITGLQASQYTLLILPALAAAVIGDFTSFPLVLCGGLLVGVLQSEVTRYVSTPGLTAVIPFACIFVALALRGGGRAFRSQGAIRLPQVGSGRVRPILLVVLIAAAVAIIEWGASPTWLTAIITMVGAAIVLLSIVVVTGYSGQLSLVQYSLAGVGAWIAGRLVTQLHMPFVAALIIGPLVALIVGIVAGIVCLRTRGMYLAVLTLAMAVGLEQLLFDNVQYTGGIDGTVVAPPRLFGLQLDPIATPARYALFGLAVFVLCGLVVANVRRGSTGRFMLAVRSNERAAASLGVSTFAAKLYGFGLGSVIAGLGGIVVAFANPTIIYSQFSADISITVVTLAIVGGVGWIAGALIGGTMVIGSVGSQLLTVFGENVQQYLTLITGVLLVVTLLVAPDGVAAANLEFYQRVSGYVRSRVSGVRPGRGRALRSTPASGSDISGDGRLGRRTRTRAGSGRDVTPGAGLDVSGRVPPRRLEVSGLSVAFGGVHAVNDVSLTVEPGEVLGVIGPNGAGKTTLIDGLSGFVKVSSGSVFLGEERLDSRPAAARAKCGLGRSFQSLELFEDMTVAENIQVAVDRRPWWRLLTDLVLPITAKWDAFTGLVIGEFGLGDLLAARPGDLPYGTRRLVAIARVVALGPSVLVLDEPAAGLDGSERRELTDLIRRLADKWGMAIVVVEHDVDLVMNCCDRIMALNFGRRIGYGTPAEIQRSAAVVDAYLGAAKGRPGSIDRAEVATSDSGD